MQNHFWLVGAAVAVGLCLAACASDASKTSGPTAAAGSGTGAKNFTLKAKAK